MRIDTLSYKLHMLIFQYIDIRPDRCVKSLSDTTTYTRIKKHHNVQEVCSSWYEYEKMSRCKYCKGRYIYNNKGLMCSNCGHVTKTHEHIDTRARVWRYKLDRTHSMLRIMYSQGGKRNYNYIWSANQSRWKDVNDKLN